MTRAFFLFFAGILLAGSANPPEKSYYVHIKHSSRAQLMQLTQAGFDIGGIDLERDRITLIVPEHDLARTRSFDVIGKEEIPLVPDAQYKKHADIVRILQDIESKYPNLASVESIGKSIEGRDIMAIQVTAKFVKPWEKAKETILIDAMHHAREIMTPEVALDMADYLTKNYGTDPEVTKWLNNYSIWIVPMVNPDGNNKVWNSSSMWRKNTRNGHGVDNNRNYTYDWNTCNGSSGSTSSETYRGASPGSEPETQALMNLAKRIKPTFNISYHSYSEIVIYPFGCSPKKIPSADRELYEGIGKTLADKLVRDSGSGSYEAGTSYELLYDVDGGSVDFMYADLGVMSFVIEMNSSSQGFQPSYSQWREKTVTKQREGWKYILSQMETVSRQRSAAK